LAKREARGRGEPPPTKRQSFPRGAILAGGFAVAIIAVMITVTFNTTGGKAPNFEMTVYRGQDVLGGETVELHDVLDQGKPIILNFWAALCPPCRQEMPGFQRLYNSRGEEYIMIGVDVGPFVGLGSHQDAVTFLDEFRITYPTAWAPSRDPVIDYAVQSMPTTVFLTPDGTIFDRTIGFMPENKVLQKLERLLLASQLPK
jgi:thiol-disulfide isomerase/thioredoxin